MLTELIPTTGANVVDSVSHNHVFCFFFFFPYLKDLEEKASADFLVCLTLQGMQRRKDRPAMWFRINSTPYLEYREQERHQ